MGHHPVAPAPGPRERLGVGVRQRAPGRVADVEHEQARRDLLPRERELAADRGLRRRGLLEDRRRRLALGVVAEAPAVGQRASGLEAAQRERRRELALERHREQVGHGGTLAESRAVGHGAARRAASRDRRATAARDDAHSEDSAHGESGEGGVRRACGRARIAGAEQRCCAGGAPDSRLCSPLALAYAAGVMAEAPSTPAESAGMPAPRALDVRQLIDDRPLGRFQRGVVALCGIIVVARRLRRPGHGLRGAGARPGAAPRRGPRSAT